MLAYVLIPIFNGLLFICVKLVVVEG